MNQYICIKNDLVSFKNYKNALYRLICSSEFSQLSKTDQRHITLLYEQMHDAVMNTEAINIHKEQEAAARAEKIKKAKSLGVYPLIKYRLEQLRHEILAESISTAEIVELQNLADFIEDCDNLLLEWAGVEEGSR